jgi:hypothetical protein
MVARRPATQFAVENTSSTSPPRSARAPATLYTRIVPASPLEKDVNEHLHLKILVAPSANEFCVNSNIISNYDEF